MLCNGKQFDCANREAGCCASSEAEIAAAEDEIKSVMGDEETLLAGAFKVDWKTVITSRIATTALKKMMPEIAERFMKQTTTRRFCVR